MMVQSDSSSFSYSPFFPPCSGSSPPYPGLPKIIFDLLAISTFSQVLPWRGSRQASPSSIFSFLTSIGACSSINLDGRDYQDLPLLAFWPSDSFYCHVPGKIVFFLIFFGLPPYGLLIESYQKSVNTVNKLGIKMDYPQKRQKLIIAKSLLENLYPLDSGLIHQIATFASLVMLGIFASLYKYIRLLISTMSTAQKKQKGLQKYSFRGYTPEQIDSLTQEQVVQLFRARQRRRFARKIKHRYNRLYMKCKKAKKNTLPGDKPVPVKTHLRDAIIMPDMVGSNVAVHNGKAFNIVEIKFDMIGRYLGEFSLTYKHTKHGKAGVGATKGSAHTALK